MLSAARRRIQLVAVASLLIPMPAFAQASAQAPAPAPPVVKASVDTTSAKTWLTDRDKIEAFIKTAAVVEMEELKIGVTRPKRMKLAPGGPVEYIAFKHVPPGRPAGYWESYRS